MLSYWLEIMSLFIYMHCTHDQFWAIQRHTYSQWLKVHKLMSFPTPENLRMFVFAFMCFIVGSFIYEWQQDSKVAFNGRLGPVLPAHLHTRQTPNKNHNQDKLRKWVLFRGNKGKHGLCGQNSEAETDISTTTLLLWFFNNVALYIFMNLFDLRGNGAKRDCAV